MMNLEPCVVFDSLNLTRERQAVLNSLDDEELLDKFFAEETESLRDAIKDLKWKINSLPNSTMPLIKC